MHVESANGDRDNVRGKAKGRSALDSNHWLRLHI